ncbi:hypothetical protein [Sabulibacter ruber]|uniref:hypothetical protein n=1 Tax=Sabulibacter ruber TaxID=2811901 RepID=UPI001A975E0B|nr:hypothetical protein [Sabulibacter ruber]
MFKGDFRIEGTRRPAAVFFLFQQRIADILTGLGLRHAFEEAKRKMEFSFTPKEEVPVLGLFSGNDPEKAETFLPCKARQERQKEA